MLETKAVKYLFVGLLADAAVALAGLLLLALMAALDYDGQCGFGFIFGTPRTPCSLAQHVAEVVALFGLLFLLEYWWLVIPLLLLPPFAGFVVGLRRPAGARPR